MQLVTVSNNRAAYLEFSHIDTPDFDQIQRNYKFFSFDQQMTTGLISRQDLSTYNLNKILSYVTIPGDR